MSTGSNDPQGQVPPQGQVATPVPGQPVPHTGQGPNASGHALSNPVSARPENAYGTHVGGQVPKTALELVEAGTPKYEDVIKGHSFAHPTKGMQPKVGAIPGGGLLGGFAGSFLFGQAVKVVLGQIETALHLTDAEIQGVRDGTPNPKLADDLQTVKGWLDSGASIIA